MYFNMEMLGYNYNRRDNEVRRLHLMAESPFIQQFFEYYVPGTVLSLLGIQIEIAFRGTYILKG